MGFLIDTNLFIAAEGCRRAGELSRLLKQFPEEDQDAEVFISVVTITHAD